jgi:vacuolar protein sorting-associated protein IST1
MSAWTLHQLYAELLLARFALLDNPASTTEPDPGVKEAVCSIMYAAPRTEVRELQVLRDILMHKYSRDFAIATMSNEHGDVNERVVKKLEIFRPPPELIDGYLDAISEHYKVGWTSGREQVPEGAVPSAEFDGGPSDEAAAATDAAGGEKVRLVPARTSSLTAKGR